MESYNESLFRELIILMEEKLMIPKDTNELDEIVVKQKEAYNKEEAKIYMPKILQQFMYLSSIDYYTNRTSIKFNNVKKLGLVYDTLKMCRTKNSLRKNVKFIQNNLTETYRILDNKETYVSDLFLILICLLNNKEYLYLSVLANCISELLEVDKNLVEKKDKIRQFSAIIKKKNLSRKADKELKPKEPVKDSERGLNLFG